MLLPCGLLPSDLLPSDLLPSDLLPGGLLSGLLSGLLGGLLLWSLQGPAAMAAEPLAPYQVVFFQETGYSGKSDLYTIDPAQAYAAFRTDDALETRHFIKSLRVGPNVGVLAMYDNTAPTARPRTRVYTSDTTSLGDLNWFVTSVVIFNRSIVGFPEGVRFANRPTSQPPDERKELFYLVGQTQPDVEAIQRHGLRYMHLFGPTTPAPASAPLGEAAETILTMDHVDSNGGLIRDIYRQEDQNAWRPHVYADLAKSTPLQQITALNLSGSNRFVRSTSVAQDGQGIATKPASPAGSLTIKPLPSDGVLLDRPQSSGPLQPNVPSDGLTPLNPPSSRWTSDRGLLTVCQTASALSGFLHSTDQKNLLVSGRGSSAAYDLTIHDGNGQLVASAKLSFASDGRSASGTWKDFPTGSAQPWTLKNTAP